MSTKGARNYRPEIHFTPKTGWINDPNGLVCVNGMYHLFAQYFTEPHWGPMHWYHAKSRDLIHWEHLPIALEPDELGFIFSGSAVYDSRNTSGFGSAENPPIVAMYTSHGEHEQQSIAWSTDGVNFTKYEGNPVIPNTELRDFRDPKVFANPIRGGWSVVLSVGDRAMFYASNDLKNWTKTGEFGPEGNRSEGVWECADLFPLVIGGVEKWVLFVSMGANRANHGARTQYFIGKFDGDKFICDAPFEQAEFVDSGLDNYAAVTYSGAPDRTLIGWAANWVYANDLPTDDFCCQMTLARKLSLVNTPLGGVRLAQQPVLPDFKPADRIDSELFKLTVSGEGAATVRLTNGGEWFDFGVNDKNELFFDRSHAGEKDFNADFADDWYSKISAPRFFGGAWTIDLIFDHSIAELYCDGGTRAMANLVYPTKPYDRAEVVSGAAKVEISK